MQLLVADVMEVVTDTPPSGDVAGSDSANTLLAEYVAANANLRNQREKLEKDLAAVRQAHEDLLFQRHDHTEESSDEGRALRMKLELHKNQVIFGRVWSLLYVFFLELKLLGVQLLLVQTRTRARRVEYWYFQHVASSAISETNLRHSKRKCKKNHNFAKAEKNRVC